MQAAKYHGITFGAIAPSHGRRKVFQCNINTDAFKIFLFSCLFSPSLFSMGGGDHCAVWGCSNDRRYPERYDLYCTYIYVFVMYRRKDILATKILRATRSLLCWSTVHVRVHRADGTTGHQCFYLSLCSSKLPFMTLFSLEDIHVIIKICYFCQERIFCQS